MVQMNILDEEFLFNLHWIPRKLHCSYFAETPQEFLFPSYFTDAEVMINVSGRVERVNCQLHGSVASLSWVIH